MFREKSIGFNQGFSKIRSRSWTG